MPHSVSSALGIELMESLMRGELSGDAIESGILIVFRVTLQERWSGLGRWQEWRED